MESETKNEIKFLEGPQSRWYDFKYTISVFLEFIKGFRALHFVGPCVTIFGSARFKEDHPYYEETRKLAGEIAKLGLVRPCRYGAASIVSGGSGGRVVARAAPGDGRSRVALLGTRFTMTEPFLRSRFESRGITLAPIAPEWMKEVVRIIFEELAAGRIVRDSQRKLKTLITELAKQKVQAVVLGCTELVLAVDVRANVLPVYDTTAIHARAAVDWMLGDQEEARAAA